MPNSFLSGGCSGGGSSGPVDWTAVQNKPTTFPPDAHNHDGVYEPADAGIQSHLGSTSNPHGVTKAQVGLGNCDNTSDANKPISTATQTALDGKAATSHNHSGVYEPANANIQSHIGSTSNPHSVTKSQVGLGNCDNTSDANKPISTATQTALDGKSATTHNHTGVYEPANSNIQTHVTSSHAPSDAQKNSDITKAEIEAKLTGEISSHTHAGGGGGGEAFPVGSVFISVVSTDPATLLGYGTWSAFGAGRVLVGLDSGQTEFDTLEETGGAKTHTLSTSEIPAHNHTITDPGHTHVQGVNSTSTGGTSGYTADTSTNNRVNSGYSTSSATTGITVDNAGGGGAHNNLQPYIVVNFWKRTA